MSSHVHQNTFKTYGEQLSHIYWYIVAGVLGFAVLTRFVNLWEKSTRLKRAQDSSITHPSRPVNILEQTLATATAISRELKYPKLYFNNSFSWLSPPSSGRVLLLVSYWGLIIFMIVDEAVIYDIEYYERIAFRGAWITMLQIPLLFLLAAKVNVIGCIVGCSHERLNWFHRWLARTILVTTTIHGAFFMREWILADFLAMELKLMPMVKYGLGAWAVLVWTFITSLLPLRRVAYEFFVFQHIVSAVVFLWLVWVHIPSYSRLYVWMAIATLCLDWFLRGALFLYQNVLVQLRTRSLTQGLQLMGYRAELQWAGDHVTVITIHNVPLVWKPGQHVFLWLPFFGPSETHPLTIANSTSTDDTQQLNRMQFVVYAQSGFSRRIHQRAKRFEGQHEKLTLRAFVGGPYGVPPDWRPFETLILISASTGGSFTLPILENALRKTENSCVNKIYFLLIAREKSTTTFYQQQIRNLLHRHAQVDFLPHIEFAITGEGSEVDEPLLISPDPTKVVKEEIFSQPDLDEQDVTTFTKYKVISPRQTHSAASSVSLSGDIVQITTRADEYAEVDLADGGERSATSILFTKGRPDLRKFISEPVESCEGETGVIVCGGPSVTSAVRTIVSRLSDDRGVHKGSGAQGIFLHVDEYSF